MSLIRHLLPRQVSNGPTATNNNNNNDNDSNTDGFYDGWWYSSTAYAIKWAVIGAIFVLFLAFFLGGLLHAKRRMKKGLAPLPYHRWLIPRRTRLHFHSQHPELPNPYPPSQYQYYGPGAPYRPGYGEQRGYNMGPMGPGAGYGPPPPAYGHDDWVPPYAPPEGGSKANPDQNTNVHVREAGGPSQNQVPAYPGGDLGNRHV